MGTASASVGLLLRLALPLSCWVTPARGACTGSAFPDNAHLTSGVTGCSTGATCVFECDAGFHGTGDGLYAKAPTSDTVGHVSEDDQGDYPFEFSPPLPWRYTLSGTHTTAGGYVDELWFSVGVTASGSKVRMSSVRGRRPALEAGRQSIP